MVVILSHQEKVKNEIFSSEAVKVLSCREVDVNLEGNFICTDYLFA